EAAELRVADVVEHDEQDVRRACPRSRLVRPPRLRLPVVPPDPPFELARFHGLQHGAQWFVRAARSRYDGDAARAKGVPSAWTSRSDARTGSCQCIHLAPKACTTLPSNTTPAASASSSTCTAGPATASSSSPSARCATSTTGVRPARRPTSATA